MEHRITEKNLVELCKTINRLTNSPMEYDYFNPNTGKREACIGHYFVMGAYGKYQLQRLDTPGFGVTLPMGYGFFTKRELYNRMHAFINGLYAKEA